MALWRSRMPDLTTAHSIACGRAIDPNWIDEAWS